MDPDGLWTARRNHPVRHPVCRTGTPGALFRASRDEGRSETPRLSPCRRRETIFRGPGAWGSASAPHAPRRSRLAGTPAGVSESGTRVSMARGLRAGMSGDVAFVAKIPSPTKS